MVSSTVGIAHHLKAIPLNKFGGGQSPPYIVIAESVVCSLRLRRVRVGMQYL